MNRPNFNEIKSYQEFKKYYWYRSELTNICRQLNIEHQGTKSELEDYLQNWFNGNFVRPHVHHQQTVPKPVQITSETPLLSCDFAFNQKFRQFFSSLTHQRNFKFTADMATAWRKVKLLQDHNFTIQDMLNIYLGQSTYAHYNHQSCQWNTFYKNFCNDSKSHIFPNKMKVASILWKGVRNSNDDKEYSSQLLTDNWEVIKKYSK